MVKYYGQKARLHELSTTQVQGPRWALDCREGDRRKGLGIRTQPESDSGQAELHFRLRTRGGGCGGRGWLQPAPGVIRADVAARDNQPGGSTFAHPPGCLFYFSTRLYYS